MNAKQTRTKFRPIISFFGPDQKNQEHSLGPSTVLDLIWQMMSFPLLKLAPKSVNKKKLWWTEEKNIYFNLHTFIY